MSRLSLSFSDLERIRLHAEERYPEECCGFLIGRTAEDRACVERVLSADNERQESRHNRYLINPEAVLAAHRQARGLGLEVIGYYHSHPDHPALPSDFDREHAWPGVSYLIVSIAKGVQVEARSWRLVNERERFDEEVFELEADDESSEAHPKEDAP